MAYGGGSARDWQNDEQTGGRSEYEKQSWRDSYNGGRAAGDWTGNTNARLDAEREAFQGATWSGSSSQPSALELARYIGTIGPGTGGAGTPGAVTAGPGGVGAVTRPGQAGIVAPGPAAPNKPGVPGVGNPAIGLPKQPDPTIARRTSTILQQIGPGGPLRPKMEPTVQELLLGGMKIQPKRNTSNAEEWEIRYAEPGEWVGGIVVMAQDAGHNLALTIGWDSIKSGRDIRHHVTGENIANGVKDFARYLDDTRRDVLTERIGRTEISPVTRTPQLGTDRYTSTMKTNIGIGGSF